MIIGIEGIPGSGKSYEAVAFHVLPALKAGRKVITNLPLDVDAFAAIDPDYPELIEIRETASPVLGLWDASNIAHRPAFQLFPDGHTEPVSKSVFVFSTVWDYYDEWRGSDGRGPLFIIDECHVSLPKGGTRPEVVEWFSLHRHFNVDVVLLTQSFRNINQPIAQLLASLIKCRKADIIGKADHYIRKVHAGYRGAVIQTSNRPYKKQYFGLYNSHTQGLNIEETEAQDVSPFVVKFNRFKWIFIACSLCFLVWAFWPKSKEVAEKKHAAAASSAQAALPAAQPKRAGVATVPVPSAMKEGQPEQPALDFGPLGDKLVSITGTLSSARAQVIVFSVGDGSSRQFDVTSHELERAGYKVELFGYCFGWLTYQGARRAVTCDAPMNMGAQLGMQGPGAGMNEGVGMGMGMARPPGSIARSGGNGRGAPAPAPVALE